MLEYTHTAPCTTPQIKILCLHENYKQTQLFWRRVACSLVFNKSYKWILKILFKSFLWNNKFQPSFYSSRFLWPLERYVQIFCSKFIQRYEDKRFKWLTNKQTIIRICEWTRAGKGCVMVMVVVESGSVLQELWWPLHTTWQTICTVHTAHKPMTMTIITIRQPIT